MAVVSVYQILLVFIFLPFSQSQVTDITSSDAQCVPYPGGVCSDYVDYNVYLPDGITFGAIEQKLTLLNNLTDWLGEIYYPCVEAYYQYSCPLEFPRCSTSIVNNTEIPTVLGACQSACQNTIDACKTIFHITGYTDKLPNCSANSTLTNIPTQPDNHCNAVAQRNPEKYVQGFNLSGIPVGYVLSECTAPFIKDPLAKMGSNDTLDPVHCKFGCCIPCPAQNYFFKEGYPEKGFLATDIIRIVSAVLSFFVFISYLVLPDKKRHPTIIILFISGCLLVFNAVAFFSISDPKRLQCASDGIRQSTQDNNVLCAVQGALLIFSSMGSTMWCTVMILNLHLHTVWNNNFLMDKYIILNVLCWGAAGIIMGVSLGLHAIKFEFANLCLLEVDLIMKAFFYPMAAIALPGFIIHFGTFIYIGRVAMRSGMEADMAQSLSASGGTGSTNSQQTKSHVRRHRHAVAAVKIQWRPLMLASLMVISVVFYWLFYMIQINKMMGLKREPTAMYEWIGCMLDPDTHQNDCTHILEDYLPPFPLMITAEVLVSILGITLFLNFVKRSLLQEWNDLIYNIRVNILRGRHVQKNGDQFYVL